MEAQTIVEKIEKLSEKDRVAIETLIDSLIEKVSVADAELRQRPERWGALKGNLIYMAPDFDEPLEDFKEYM